MGTKVQKATLTALYRLEGLLQAGQLVANTPHTELDKRVGVLCEPDIMLAGIMAGARAAFVEFYGLLEPEASEEQAADEEEPSHG